MDLIQILKRRKIISLELVEQPEYVGFELVEYLASVENIKTREFSYLFHNLLDLDTSYYLDSEKSFFLGRETQFLKEVVFLKTNQMRLDDLRSKNFNNEYINVIVELLVQLSTFENHMLYISKNMYYKDTVYPQVGMLLVKSLVALEKISESQNDFIDSEWIKGEKISFFDLEEIDELLNHIDIDKFTKAYEDVLDKGYTDIQPKEEELTKLRELKVQLRNVDYHFDNN